LFEISNDLILAHHDAVGGRPSQQSRSRASGVFLRKAVSGAKRASSGEKRNNASQTVMARPTFEIIWRAIHVFLPGFAFV